MIRTTSHICLGVASLALSQTAIAREIPETSSISFEAPILEEAYKQSPFGMRQDPFLNRPSWHNGIDLGADWNAPISAPASGTIILADTRAGYGKLIELQVSEDWILRFAHLKEISVVLGEDVEAGDFLGEVGSTGRAAGPHLHLEALYADKQYNPEHISGLELYASEKSRD